MRGGQLDFAAFRLHFKCGPAHLYAPYDSLMTLAPDVFAGYRIVRLLGSGGMGEVYLAQHPRLPRRDALKILSSAVSADTVFRARFSREADIAAALSHPHIVTVHDRGEFEGQLWISMEYVDGTDAARLVHDRYPAGMPPDEAVEIITAVAGALDYAHRQGLLHRDVKPANILLSQPDDEVNDECFWRTSELRANWRTLVDLLPPTSTWERSPMPPQSS